MKISTIGVVAVAVPGALWAGVGVHVAAEAVNGSMGGRGFLALLVGAAVATLAAAVLFIHYSRNSGTRAQAEAMNNLADAVRSHDRTEARWEERFYRGAERAKLDAADHNARFPSRNDPIPADTGPFPSLGPFMGN
ncbi:hypothetical protein [Microbispora sp. KK1-11]|uniref:hypothetical protein n=1 Tax=Microbispora sp. KK1-11 TaxID=2053005 RepID=UPI0011571D22|nr:hypothetical protein [Microbispora sp. KK1-11]TQS29998.1 hypothetical protein FLW16_06455 [Microbispora sp. KK1-11]